MGNWMLDWVADESRGPVRNYPAKTQRTVSKLPENRRGYHGQILIFLALFQLHLGFTPRWNVGLAAKRPISRAFSPRISCRLSWRRLVPSGSPPALLSGLGSFNGLHREGDFPASLPAIQDSAIACLAAALYDRPHPKVFAI